MANAVLNAALLQSEAAALVDVEARMWPKPPNCQKWKAFPAVPRDRLHLWRRSMPPKISRPAFCLKREIIPPSILLN